MIDGIANDGMFDKPIGFVGTGAIAEAVVLGMVQHGGFAGPIRVSRRSRQRSANLERRFSNVEVVEDNQKIVDQSEWVFVAVLPEQARSIISELEFRAGQTLISLVAGISVEELLDLASPVSHAHRIIPLPPIEHGVGPLPIYPPNLEIARLFNRFGKSVEIEDEQQFSTFSAASAVMATHHRLTSELAKWIVGQGVPKEAAAVYASEMLNSLSALECAANYEQLLEMAEDCLTAGGLNEQVLNELQADGWFENLEGRLDRIAERLASQKNARNA